MGNGGAIVVDDSEALRESHARTLTAAGYAARGLSFEAAMALPDEELSSVDLIVVDLHDARGREERRRSAEAHGIGSKVPEYDHLAGMRLLQRLDDLRPTVRRIPAVVVASAIMQIDRDVTARMYEFEVVSGGFSTLGIGAEADWLAKVLGAMSPDPHLAETRASERRAAQNRWTGTVSNLSFRRLVAIADRNPRAMRYILRKGERPTRPAIKELKAVQDQVRASASARGRRRDRVRSLYRKVFGADLPNADS